MTRPIELSNDLMTLDDNSRNFIRNLLAQCLQKQKDLFYKIFNCDESLVGLSPDKFKCAVGLIERTLKKNEREDNK